MRLTLVSHDSPSDAQHLAQALYGILMLLPQTDAFHLLKNRLQCVPNYWQQHGTSSPAGGVTFVGGKLSFDELLQHFKEVQQLHRSYKTSQRKASIQIWEKKK